MNLEEQIAQRVMDAIDEKHYKEINKAYLDYRKLLEKQGVVNERELLEKVSMAYIKFYEELQGEENLFISRAIMESYEKK